MHLPLPRYRPQTLADVLCKGEDADRVKVSLCLFHLASMGENIPSLCSPDLALVPLLQGAVQRAGEQGSVRANLLGVLLFIFQVPSNRLTWANPALAEALGKILLQYRSLHTFLMQLISKSIDTSRPHS